MEPREQENNRSTDGTAAERFAERNRPAILVALSAIYFGATLLRAHGRPFWFDEILTLAAAWQPSVASAVTASRVFDVMPPLVHVVAHLIHITVGTGEVVLRIPGMIGFWVFCLCLFRFARRSVGTLFALPALLLPFATDSYGYSFEARCYGMLVGFAGLALICWQSAAAGERRRLTLAGLTLGIMGATACHYYAIFLYLPLAGGEALRSWGRRRIDWPMWIAFAMGAVPMGMFLFTIRTAMRDYAHPWSRASVRDYLEFYENQFQHALMFAIPALVLLAVWIVLEKPRPGGAPWRRVRTPDYELFAAALFLAIPVAAITIALVVPPHLFTERYAILSIAGLALLVPLLAARFAAGLGMVGAILAVTAMVPFLGELAQVRPLVNPLDREPLLRQALERGPVAVDDGVMFLQLWYYAPENLRRKLFYVADRSHSLQYIKTDSIDLNLLSVNRVWPIPVVRYEEFASPGKEFLLYLSGNPGWLPRKTVADGGRLTILATEGDRSLARARLPMPAQP